jgi:hypothetical protein
MLKYQWISSFNIYIIIDDVSQHQLNVELLSSLPLFRFAMFPYKVI